MYLLTSFGKQLLSLPEEQALEQIYELQREYNRRQRRENNATNTTDSLTDTEDIEAADTEAQQSTEVDDDDPGTTWKTRLLKRLHQLTPEGFEKFVVYLLRRYGLELTRIGGTGDEGIDGIGTAPLSPVLSSRVAIQVKRYEPNGNPIGRETVALFQRDAQTKGAERAILVTLSRFTAPARKIGRASCRERGSSAGGARISRVRHTRSKRDWSSDVCSSDLHRHSTTEPCLILPCSYSSQTIRPKRQSHRPRNRRIIPT